MTFAADAEEVQVRPAERADVLSIHRIERASFPQPWPFEAFDRYLDAPAFFVAVEPDGSIDGGDTTGSGPGSDAGGTRDGPGDRSGGDDATDGTVDFDAQTVVGFVVGDMMANHGRAIGHVKDLAVHPDYRERGIGRTLLERALETLSEEGATSVKLEVRVSNHTARELYRSYDFVPMRRRPGYYDDGEDALVLGREL